MMDCFGLESLDKIDRIDRKSSSSWKSDISLPQPASSDTERWERAAESTATSNYFEGFQARGVSAGARSATRARLINLVRDFYRNGYPSTSGHLWKIDRQTLEAAIVFLQLLPEQIDFPKVIPDGEGGLVMQWDQRQSPALLVVDRWKLHGVGNAGTDQAEYLEPVTLMPSHIPPAVLAIVA